MSFMTLKRPDEAGSERFLQAQSALPITYHGGLEAKAGFTFKRTPQPLGSGLQVFERAVLGLKGWAVYPAWLRLYPHPAPLAEGTCVALLTGFAPVWTVSAVRVVATEASERHFSFTLGTLPHHAVSGLERFRVYQDDAETVWYEITAVSRPQHPLVKLGAPVLRRVQGQFARDSVRSLRRFVTQSFQP
jgi:uncharacterized protein (UPF0548 family)